MKLFIGADHNGLEMKDQLVKWLRGAGHEVADLGPETFEKTDDYPDFGIRVAQSVVTEPASRGIVICGSGVGMAVVANKVQGIRASLIHDPTMATAAQRDDDINVLALGAWYIDLETAKQVIINWLTTPFSGEERHVRRIGKITEHEKEWRQHD